MPGNTIEVTVEGLKCLVKPPTAVGTHLHHRRIGICCHSTEDNSVVKVWRNLESNPAFSRLTGPDTKVPFVLNAPVTGKDVLVFGLAVLVAPYPLSDLECLALQGTGILDTSHLKEGSETQEVTLYEIMGPDRNRPDLHAYPILNLTIRIKGVKGITKGPLPAFVGRYTREKIARAWTTERFGDDNENGGDKDSGVPQAPKDSGLPPRPPPPHPSAKDPAKLFRFKTSSDRLTTSTDWIAGKPYPLWRTGPHFVAHQQFPVTLLRSLLRIARRLVHPRSLNPLLEQAQHASTLLSLSMKFVNDYFIFSTPSAAPRKLGEDRETLDDEVRDVTFFSTVFWCGDCEDCAYLCAAVWRALATSRDLVGEEEKAGDRENLAAVQEAMRRCSDPYTCSCYYPLAQGEQIGHSTCLVFGPEGTPILLDGIQNSQSFISPELGQKYTDHLHKARSLVGLSYLADSRVSVSTHQGSDFASRFLVCFSFSFFSLSSPFSPPLVGHLPNGPRGAGLLSRRGLPGGAVEGPAALGAGNGPENPLPRGPGVLEAQAPAQV